HARYAVASISQITCEVARSGGRWMFQRPIEARRWAPHPSLVVVETRMLSVDDHRSYAIRGESPTSIHRGQLFLSWIRVRQGQRHGLTPARASPPPQPLSR